MANLSLTFHKIIGVTYLLGKFTVPAPLDETNPAIRQFIEKYAKLNGNEPPILFVAANAYDTAKIVAKVVETTGNDADKIKQAFYDMPAYQGLSGVIDFDSKGDATKEFVFQIIESGKFLPYAI